MRSESRTVTRDELYEQVWTTPMVHLAIEYGISDVGLAKVCRKHRIPCPGVGYWARKQHGKALRWPRLPRVDDPRLETIRFCWVVLSDEDKE